MSFGLVLVQDMQMQDFFQNNSVLTNSLGITFDQTNFFMKQNYYM